MQSEDKIDARKDCEISEGVCDEVVDICEVYPSRSQWLDDDSGSPQRLLNSELGKE